MFTHDTHVGQTVVICCRSLWERYGLMQGRDFVRHTELLLWAGLSHRSVLSDTVPPDSRGVMRVKSFASAIRIYGV